MNGEASGVSVAAQGRRLEAVREQLGLSKPEMADLLGASRRTYDRYAAGTQELRADHLAKLDAKGIDATWFVTGRGGMLGGSDKNGEGATKLKVREAAPEPPEGFVLVPRYDVEASAGHGALIEGENIIDFMAFQESWVRRVLRVDPRRLVLISATGDSMEPAIRSGDLLLIDTSVDRVMDDSIYLISHHEVLMVKRIQLLFDGVVVKSDNSNYVEMTLGPTEMGRLLIRGRVRWIGRLI